jgi:transcriptional regulator with XRE-family HTH domain
MTPSQIRTRRIELGLTVDELAFALNLTRLEVLQAENGQGDLCTRRSFEEAFDQFEERVFGTFCGA